jgi:hypothetical protein
MIASEFMKLYEKLNTLNEKWYDMEDYGNRLWFSDSAVEFKNFMRNLPSSGLKGVRLCIAPDFYLAADAGEYQHDTMVETARDSLYIPIPDNIERTTCGIPKCTDFELGNFEIEQLRQDALDDPDDETLAMYLDYDAEQDYLGTLVADYGIFELSLYNFKSKECPEYISDRSSATYFEDSETYRVLKPLLKRIYVYGK